MANNKRRHVFLDIASSAGNIGRMTFELYADCVPLTVENFRCLCTGERFSQGKSLHFAGTPFHRILPGFCAQSGDINNGNGSGGESVYGTFFPDESFDGLAGRHTGVGTLSMVNSGPNTNSSQFFVCLGETPWLDGKHVVFGQLVDGLDVLFRLESFGTREGAPKERVWIETSGEL